MEFLKTVMFSNFLEQNANVKVLCNFAYWLFEALFQLEIAYIGSYINEMTEKWKYIKIVLNEKLLISFVSKNI